MNLDRMEEKLLNYLRQVSNPLVRIDVLYDHLRQDKQFKELSREDLLDFLNPHDQVKVIQSLGDPQTSLELEEAGFSTGPCVILRTRVPTGDQLGTMMVEQLKTVHEALGKALLEARECGDTSTESEIRKALERSSDLRRRLTEFGPSIDSSER